MSFLTYRASLAIVAVSLSPVVKYHGLARCHLTPSGFLMRPQLNGGTLGRLNVFERVLTMTDYYDGPRAGIAELEGVPHFYESEWADGEELDADVFKLSPVPANVLPLALEDWQIWRRWEVAFHRGETSQETHPALPEDRARHDELASLLTGRMSVDPNRTIRATASFRWRPDLNEFGLGFHPLEVEWMRL